MDDDFNDDYEWEDEDGLPWDDDDEEILSFIDDPLFPF